MVECQAVTQRFIQDMETAPDSEVHVCEQCIEPHAQQETHLDSRFCFCGVIGFLEKLQVTRQACFPCWSFEGTMTMAHIRRLDRKRRIVLVLCWYHFGESIFHSIRVPLRASSAARASFTGPPSRSRMISSSSMSWIEATTMRLWLGAEQLIMS